jgi:DNA-binding Lrp family transcriptional regulator
MKLDYIDAAIINCLIQDGRKSFRQIAKEIRVSVPTVESHFNKMKSLGIIKNIEPILDWDKIQTSVSALVYLNVNPSSLAADITNNLCSLSEVKNILMTTGEDNIVLKVTVERLEQLDEIVRHRISTIEGIKFASYQIITKVVKNDRSIPVKEGLSIKVECDYCRNEVSGSGKVFSIGNRFERNFCCNSCLTLYKQKYRGRIEALSK